MEKRRALMFTTMMLLVLYCCFMLTYLLSLGWNLSYGIVNAVYTNLYIHGYVGIGLSSLGIFIYLGGSGFIALFLLLFIVFFIISKKKAKLTIMAYVTLALLFCSVLSTLFLLAFTQILLNVNEIVYNGSGPIFYGHYHKVESVRIEDTVRCGLSMLGNALLLGSTIVPLITLLLSFVVGRGKKKAQDQQPEEAKKEASPAIEEIK